MNRKFLIKIAITSVFKGRKKKFYVSWQLFHHQVGSHRQNSAIMAHLSVWTVVIFTFLFSQNQTFPNHSQSPFCSNRTQIIWNQNLSPEAIFYLPRKISPQGRFLRLFILWRFLVIYGTFGGQYWGVVWPQYLHLNRLISVEQKKWRCETLRS